MKKEEMDRIIREEMKHIPKGQPCSKQQNFRCFYSGWRRIVLRDFPDIPRGLAFKKVIEDYYRKTEPDFNPSYDKGWFEKED